MLDPEVRDVIQQARDLIADPARWCQGVSALKVKGFQIGRTHGADPEAIAWCAVGSIDRQSRDNDLRMRAFQVLSSMARVMHNNAHTSIIAVNDKLGHEATIAVFDKVLADETISD